jgi:hypothetical protein
MRLLSCLLVLFLAAPLRGQIVSVYQPQLDFEAAMIAEVEQVGDTSRLTSTQKKAAWEELEARLVGKLGAKPWIITLRVEDVRPDSKSDRIHEIRFEPTVAVPGSRCTWRFNGTRVKLPIDKATAAKIHKGDYIDFTGVPLKLAADAPKTKQLEFERRVQRGLAFPVSIEHDKAATFRLVVGELKYRIAK